MIGNPEELSSYLWQLDKDKFNRKIKYREKKIETQRKIIGEQREQIFQLKDQLQQKDKEIERLNNIINELEKYLNEQVDYMTHHSIERMVAFDCCRHKLQELKKGSVKE